MTENPIELARFNMIQQQVRPWSVIDNRVLDVMMEVPREHFVPEAYRSVAFADIEIPLPSGRTIPSPKIEAKMLQALAVKPEDTVLVIGVGSGYLAACLAKLGKYVVSIDPDEDAAKNAAARLEALGIDNAEISLFDINEDLPRGKYDAILFTSSLIEWDERFERLMNVGGRLFVVTGQSPTMEAGLITRTEEREWRYTSLFETDLEPMDKIPLPESFNF